MIMAAVIAWVELISTVLISALLVVACMAVVRCLWYLGSDLRAKSKEVA